MFSFLLLVPCPALVVLGLWMIEQESQLEGKRLTEERQRLMEQVNQELLSHLEKIKLQQATKWSRSVASADLVRPEKSVALVGPLLNGQLQLPWEHSSKARAFRNWLERGEFRQKDSRG